MIMNEICNGVFSIKSNLHIDDRGTFFELYNKSIFSKSGLTNNFIQDNISYSKYRNTVRGLHYQKPPYEQSKFIFVISGAIFDFFIDIRKESNEFGRCYSVELNSLGDTLYIPKGFLHGFCTLEDNTIIGYKVDEVYKADHEIGLTWNDPHIDLKLPFDKSPIISNKDSHLLCWDDFIKELGPS